MSDISLKLRAEALAKSIENLAPRVEEELNEAVKNLAYAAHSAMVNKIQTMSMDPKNRSDYLKALKIQDLGKDSYLISLDGDWANKLESGFGGYSLKDVLLKSTKIVKVGSRAGEPWVRKAKDGHKYAAVPLQHKSGSPSGGSGDLATDIKKMIGEDQAGNQQRMTQIFKDVDGNPRSGKVATLAPNQQVAKNLQGLTKYQYVHPTGRVSTLYMTFRIISENSTGWMHKGFEGYHLFKEAQDFVEKEMDRIILNVLK